MGEYIKKFFQSYFLQSFFRISDAIIAVIKESVVTINVGIIISVGFLAPAPARIAMTVAGII